MPSDPNAAALSAFSERIDHISERADRTLERLIDLSTSNAEIAATQRAMLAHLTQVNGSVAQTIRDLAEVKATSVRDLAEVKATELLNLAEVKATVLLHAQKCPLAERVESAERQLRDQAVTRNVYRRHIKAAWGLGLVMAGGLAGAIGGHLWK